MSLICRAMLGITSCSSALTRRLVFLISSPMRRSRVSVAATRMMASVSARNCAAASSVRAPAPTGEKSAPR
jgi:hypothetical protein